MKSFAVITSERKIKGETTAEHRLHISILPADAVRLRWRMENSPHWCLYVAFSDDLMRARTGNAVYDLSRYMPQALPGAHQCWPRAYPVASQM